MRDCTRSGLVLLLLLCFISHLNAAEQLKVKRPKAAQADTSKKNTEEKHFKKSKLNEEVQGLEFDDKGRHKLPDSWVDPADMLGYDLAKTKPNPKPSPKPKEDVSAPEEDPQPKLPPYAEDGKCSVAARYEMEQLLQDCRDKKGRYKKASELCQQQLDNRPVDKEPFFQQFVKQFVNKIHKDTQGTVQYRMDLKLSPGGVSILEKFANSELGNLQDSHQVLSEMIIGMEAVGPYVPPTWHGTVKAILEENIRLMLLVSALLTLVSILVYVLINILRIFHWDLRYLATRLLFVVSPVVFWNWWHLWKALAVTITKFLVEALEPIGRAIGPTVVGVLFLVIVVKLWFQVQPAAVQGDGATVPQPVVAPAANTGSVEDVPKLPNVREAQNVPETPPLNVLPPDDVGHQGRTLDEADGVRGRPIADDGKGEDLGSRPTTGATRGEGVGSRHTAGAGEGEGVGSRPTTGAGEGEDVGSRPTTGAGGGEGVGSRPTTGAGRGEGVGSRHTADAGEGEDVGSRPTADAGEGEDVGSRPTADAGEGEDVGSRPTAGAGGGEGVGSRPTAGAGRGEGVGSRPTADAGEGDDVGSRPTADAGEGEDVGSRPTAGAGRGDDVSSRPTAGAGGGEGVGSRPTAGAGGGEGVGSRPTAGAGGGKGVGSRPTAGAGGGEGVGSRPTAGAGGGEGVGSRPTAGAGGGEEVEDASCSQKDDADRRPTTGTSEGSSEDNQPTKNATEISGSGDGAQVQNGAKPKQPHRPSGHAPEPSGEANLGLPSPETQPPGKGDLYDPHSGQLESTTVTYDEEGQPQIVPRLDPDGAESQTAPEDNNGESATNETERSQDSRNPAAEATDTDEQLSLVEPPRSLDRM